MGLFKRTKNTNTPLIRQILDLYHFSYEFTAKENALFFYICDREKSSIAALRFIFH